MRIVALAHYYLTGHRAGAEVMLHELLRAAAGAGHEVVALATEEPPGEHHLDGVRVVGGPRALRELRAGPWHVAVSHLKEVARVAPWARRERVPLVQVLHSTHAWIARGVAAGANLFVANSHHVAAHHAPRMRAPHLVVHPPVFAGRHRTVPGDRVSLVNLLPEKGAGTFYELARRMPGTGFLGVRGGYETARQDVRDLTNVQIQANTEDMRAVWSRTRVLLMPSEHESYGLVAVEAAASGIPTIASPTDGLREALGDAGVFVARGDIDGWEAALRDLLGGGWAAASARARARSDGLDPGKELQAWVSAIEQL